MTWAPVLDGHVAEIAAGEAELSVSSPDGRWTLSLAPPDPLPADHPSLTARALYLDGDMAETLSRLSESIQQSREEGRISVAWRDVVMTAWIVQDQEQAGGPAHALTLLESLPPGLSESLYDQFTADYGRGAALGRLGRYREALQHLSAASQGAAVLGNARLLTMARDSLAHALQRTGQHEQAVEMLRDNLAQSTHPCDRARAATGLAWGLLLANEAGEVVIDGEARQLLLQALVDLQEGCDLAPQRTVNIALNLALDATLRGDAHEAERWLAQWQSGPSGTTERRWAPWIEGQLALLRADPEAALRLFRSMSAGPALRPTVRWRGCVGEADALVMQGELDAAADRYEACTKMRVDIAVEVSALDGQVSFLSGDAGATQRHARVLLQLGREEDAFWVLRRWRAQYLNGLPAGRRLSQEEASEWKRLQDEYRTLRAALDDTAPDWQWNEERLRLAHRQKTQLSAQARSLLGELPTHPGGAPFLTPPDDGVIVAWFQIAGQWHVFAQTTGLVYHSRLHAVDLDASPETLSETLLGPVAPILKRSRTVILLSPEAFRTIDLHALPFGDTALGLTRDVVYALDVAPGAPAAAGAPLIVSDPGGDLPEAAQEGDALVATYAAHQRVVQRPVGEDLRRVSLMAALEQTSLFHFAGHGVFDPTSWESALLLAEGTTLTIGDILSLDHAPAVVVLSGCETARSAPGAVETLGLAQAFLLTGSQEVIATTRPVRDDTTRRFSVAWHRAFLQTHDRGAAWRAGVQAIRDGDWTTFRRLRP
ncbi:MAG: CHAT domain-containing tetratricopeptide repeat protein [Myxococcota bacterium]